MTSPHAPLDRRILAPGLKIKLSDLVGAFIEHYSPTPQPACSACGHRYTEAKPACPTMAVVLPLLKRRRHEDPGALPEWVRKALHGIKAPPAWTPRSPKPPETLGLFDEAPYLRAKASRRKSKPTA